MKTRLFLKPLVVIAGATAISSSLGFYVWKEEYRKPLLEIYVFALSSGRSMFIRTPEDKRILVDGGSNSEIIREISKILPFYSRRFDIVIATNTQSKNIGGLIDIIKRYKVSKVYVPAFDLQSLNLASSTDQFYETFIEMLAEKNLTSEKLQEGRILLLDSKIKLSLLFPADPTNFIYSKSSAPEILFNLNYDQNNILFLGNASNKVQKYIASTTFSRLVDSKTDVLIVSHSALPNNVSKETVDKFQPNNLIFSKRINKNSEISKAKNQKQDPFIYLKKENKFNIKELEGLKIESNGVIVIIK